MESTCGFFQKRLAVTCEMVSRKATEIRTKRLTSGDQMIAKRLFAMMSEVFEEKAEPLSDQYLEGLLSRDDFWIFAAFHGNAIVGGITAHILPLTRTESSEVFVYDLAVRQDYQRQGIGRHLIWSVREAAAAAGIQELIVPADNDDDHALDFYRAVGGEPSQVMYFTFSIGKK